MTQLQSCELKILLEVDRVCRENHIRYFLSSGTLLGAIRHQGFIPWDDDVDITMPAEDYWRFLEIAPKALGKEFFLQSTDTDLWYRAFSKVRMNHTTMIEKSYEGVRFHQGVWIDVFPIISIKDDQKHIDRFNRMLTWTDLLVQDAFFAKVEHLPLKLKLLKAVPISFRRYLCKAIRKRYIQMNRSIPTGEYYSGLVVRRARLLMRYYQEEIRVPFEGYMLPVPKDYDEILKTDYGDYMTLPPIEKRSGGHNILTLDLERDYTEYMR